MPVRIVEGKLPYTGGTGIEIDTNKVISLLLREENNLIMVNEDNEVYTDLQLESNITPSSDFPVGVTVGKVLQTDGRTQSGLILNWKTTSGDYARWIYANDGNIYFDKGTGVRNQVYYSSQVNTLITQLRDEVYEYFMRYQDFYWQNPTGVNVTLDLSIDYTPTADFVVNAPSELQEGQTYILRVNNGNTVYVMSLGENIVNMQGCSTSLSANSVDMFVFLAIDGKLELQRDIDQYQGATPNNGQLTIQKNGTTVGTFTADQATNTTVDIEVPLVEDNLTSTSTTNSLSANQGRELKSMIDDLAGFGKFLSLWNATTGLPISFPLATPYTYSTGDYFVVEVTGATNYRPNGNSYTGTASTTQETDELEVGDVYVYDGSVWLLQSNHGKTVTFGNIAGDPYDNTNLANALNDKQDVLTAGANITIAQDGTISANNTQYSSATSTVAGIVKLGDDTVQTDTIQSPASATGKTYPVQVDSNGKMNVNVPRANTTYSAGTGINIDGNNQVSNTGVTSFNGQTGAVTVDTPETKIFRINSAGTQSEKIAQAQTIVDRTIDKTYIDYNNDKLPIIVSANEVYYAENIEAWGTGLHLIFKGHPDSSGQIPSIDITGDSNGDVTNITFSGEAVINFKVFDTSDFQKVIDRIEGGNAIRGTAILDSDIMYYGTKSEDNNGTMEYTFRTIPDADGGSTLYENVIVLQATDGVFDMPQYYTYSTPLGGIQNDTTGTTTIVTKIRAGTEAEYQALSSYSADTIYHVY